MNRRNVILITVDCLRADYVGFMGYDRNTSPTMDKLTDEGTISTQAIAQEGSTKPHSNPSSPPLTPLSLTPLGTLQDTELQLAKC